MLKTTILVMAVALFRTGCSSTNMETTGGSATLTTAEMNITVPAVNMTGVAGPAGNMSVDGPAGNMTGVAGPAGNMTDVAEPAGNMTDGPCPNYRWTQHYGICYLMVPIKRTWQDASIACGQMGPGISLVRPRTNDQQDFIVNHLRAELGVGWPVNHWMDLTDRLQEGTWLFSDNSAPVDYQWHAGQPSGGHDGTWRCGEMTGQMAGWYNLWCGHQWPYICEVTVG